MRQERLDGYRERWKNMVFRQTLAGCWRSV